MKHLAVFTAVGLMVFIFVLVAINLQKKDINHDFEYRGIVEHIERHLDVRYHIQDKNEFMKLSYKERSYVANTDFSHLLVRLDCSYFFAISENKTIPEKVIKDWYKERKSIRININSSLPDLVDIEEGDRVSLKIAIIETDGGWYEYMLLAAKIIERPKKIKAALIKKIKDEEYKDKIFARLETLREYSDQWQFSYEEATSEKERAEGIIGHIHKLNIKVVPPTDVIYDNKKQEVIFLFELPATLADRFPEMIFKENHRAALWSMVSYRSGSGLPLDALRYLEK